MEKEVTWVAECASMHKGDIGLVYKMLLSCATNRVSIAKFQLGHNKDDELRYIDPWAPQMVRWAKDLGQEIMFSVFSMDALRLVRELGIKRVKLAHQVALSKNHKDSKLIEAVIASGMEVFISAPPPRLHRMRMPNVKWLHCQSTYPTYPEQMKMPLDFNKQGYFGYSSHMHGPGDAYLAVARGAKYIEKHVALDAELVTRDAAFALTFSQFREMIYHGDTIARITG